MRARKWYTRSAFLALISAILLATLSESPLFLALLAAAALLLALPNPGRKRLLTVFACLSPTLVFLPLWLLVLEGPLEALTGFLKLLCLTSFPAVFFLYCGKRELEDLLLALRLPPLLVFAISTAISLLVLATAEIRTVWDAMRSRGLPVDSPWGLFRYLPDFLLPVLLASFRVAEELSEALLVRGLGQRGKGDRET